LKEAPQRHRGTEKKWIEEEKEEERREGRRIDGVSERASSAPAGAGEHKGRFPRVAPAKRGLHPWLQPCIPPGCSEEEQKQQYARYEQDEQDEQEGNDERYEHLERGGQNT
jgi:hypothetical protein